MMTGSANLDNTNSRMMAPNPQQMTSRKDRLKISISRRRGFMLVRVQGFRVKVSMFKVQGSRNKI
jgi:hypothetical protein